MTKNTIENTPAHCHDCHQFADCNQAQNMMADTEPVEGFIYDGEVYCYYCGDGDGGDDPYEGESDTPTHCAGCGVPIIHELTIDGVEYVREQLSDNTYGCCRELWPTVWADYDIQPMIPVDSIEIPVGFQHLCKGREGATIGTIYAVSSSGGLTIGTLRPEGCDTDEKWYLTIWRNLAAEAFYIRCKAGEDSADHRELIEFEFWVDEQVERLEQSYGLADWGN
jgi:hypothetical protein